MDHVAEHQTITVTTTVGTWILKRPTLRTHFEVARRVAQRLGVPLDQVDPVTLAAARALAFIEACTVAAPPGWDWESQPDDRILMDVYNQWNAGLEQFKSDVPGQAG
jgi:hypothetical protein